MRRFQWIAWALILQLLLLPSALGENLYPTAQGPLTDLAGVLSPETAEDLSILAQRTQDAYSGEVRVVTRHFLGGKEAREYAEGLFEAWDMGEMDALLLLVIGEENYALHLGEKAEDALSGETRTSLLATHFRGAYLNREYDFAVADLALSLCQTLARSADESISVSGLFGQENIQATAPPQNWEDLRQDISSLWQDMFGSPEEKEKDEEWEKEASREETKSNWRTIIIWGLAIYFLFFRKKKKRRKFNFGHGPKRW